MKRGANGGGAVQVANAAAVALQNIQFAETQKYLLWNHCEALFLHQNKHKDTHSWKHIGLFGFVLLK